MSYTYVIANIATNKIAQMRYLIGDTVDRGHLAEDETLQFEIDTTNNVILAAANACDAIAAELSRQADKSVGDLSISLNQKQANYAQRAIDLRARDARGAGGPVTRDHSRATFRSDTFDEFPHTKWPGDREFGM